MQSVLKHWPRILVTLVPLVFALLHAFGALQIGVLQRLDDIIYDARLKATMPKTLDERIVIIDIDEKSLAEVGRWPWGRNKMAALTNELFDRQKIAILGFDIVFAEADASSGLRIRASWSGYSTQAHGNRRTESTRRGSSFQDCLQIDGRWPSSSSLPIPVPGGSASWRP